MQQITVTLSPADILTLDTIPVELLPAPGANRVLIPIAAIARVHFNLNPYFGAGTFSIALRGPTQKEQWKTGLDADLGLGGNTERYEILSPTPGNTDDPVNCQNEPLLIFSTTGPFTGGDSAIEFTILYMIAKIP